MIVLHKGKNIASVAAKARASTHSLLLCSKCVVAAACLMQMFVPKSTFQTAAFAGWVHFCVNFAALNSVVQVSSPLLDMSSNINNDQDYVAYIPYRTTRAYAKKCRQFFCTQVGLPDVKQKENMSSFFA